MKDLKGIEYSLNDFIWYAQGKKIVIFGAGKYGNYIYETLTDYNTKIFAVCDNDRAKLYSLRDKYPVSTLEDLESTLDEYYFVIAITKVDIIRKVRAQLEHWGVKTDKMVIPLPESSSGYFDGLIMFDPEYCIQAVKEQWKRTRQNSGQIMDYFESNSLYELIVFEIDELKGWLDQDLLNSRVVIRKKIKTLEEFGESERCDAIVVLDEIHYETIEEELMGKTKVPVISIWDVVRF